MTFPQLLKWLIRYYSIFDTKVHYEKAENVAALKGYTIMGNALKCDTLLLKSTPLLKKYMSRNIRHNSPQTLEEAN